MAFQLPPSAVTKVIIPRALRLEVWGDGPWLDEPDRVDFEFAGIPCLLRRNAYAGKPDASMGNWCGYAAVAPGHPLHGAGYYAAEEAGVRAHGGLTYASACAGEICHVPKPGEPDDVWWFGFDCAHSGDLVPAHCCRRTAFIGEVYRDLAYVYAETTLLAAQLAFAGTLPR